VPEVSPIVKSIETSGRKQSKAEQQAEVPEIASHRIPASIRIIFSSLRFRSEFRTLRIESQFLLRFAFLLASDPFPL
jgi:hypothetical protein